MAPLNPQLVLYVGPMFSAKTTQLLTALDRHKYQHHRVVAFKPRMDTRYGESEITTHSGWRFPAIPVEAGKDIIDHLTKGVDENVLYDVVAVDECFMIPGAADALIFLFREGVSVYVASLELSSNLTSFREVEKLMPFATSIVKCTAVCDLCGTDAHYSWKHAGKALNSSEIEVGGSEMYSPRCAKCHPRFHI